MKKLYRYLSLLFLMLCLTGCGQTASVGETEQKDEQIDWRSKGFAEAQKETEQQELWAEKYLPLHQEGLLPEVEAEAGWHQMKEEGGCAGKLLWRHTYIGDQYEWQKEYAEVYDVASGQYEMIELTMENIGLEVDSGDTETTDFAYIEDIDITADGRYAILFTERAVDEEKRGYFSKIYIVCSALDGTPAEATDVRELFLTKGIFKEEDALTLTDMECDYDAAGTHGRRRTDIPGL